MTRDEWMGWIQDFLEARMKDAPDDSCKTFAENLWQETAEDLPDELAAWSQYRPDDLTDDELAEYVIQSKGILVP